MVTGRPPPRARETSIPSIPGSVGGPFDCTLQTVAASAEDVAAAVIYGHFRFEIGGGERRIPVFSLFPIWSKTFPSFYT